MIKFNIQDGNLNIIECHGWKTRPTTMKTLLKEYFDNRSYQNTSEITVDINDSCVSIGNNSFSISATKNNANFLFPDPYSITWPEGGIDDVFDVCKNIAIKSCEVYTDNRAFWIGANTHQSRSTLMNISRIHPDKVHAIMHQTVNNNLKNDSDFVYDHNVFVSLQDHTKYKYLIDMPGAGWSARVKYLMFSRRPLFIINRLNWDWATWDLEEWKHFIPVKSDVSDLIEKIEWAENNPLEAKKIADQAFEFISKRLTKNKIFECIDQLLLTNSGTTPV